MDQFTPLYRQVNWSAMHMAFYVSIVPQFYLARNVYISKFPIFLCDEKYDVNLYALLLIFVTPK